MPPYWQSFRFVPKKTLDRAILFIIYMCSRTRLATWPPFWFVPTKTVDGSTLFYYLHVLYSIGPGWLDGRHFDLRQRRHSMGLPFLLNTWEVGPCWLDGRYFDSHAAMATACLPDKTKFLFPKQELPCGFKQAQCTPGYWPNGRINLPHKVLSYKQSLHLLISIVHLGFLSKSHAFNQG